MANPGNRRLTIGLTGGIASGKSNATRRFEHHGIVVVDADLVAREVVEPGSSALQSLVTLTDSHILNNDGSLDRSALRTLIFNDATLREKVEAILHPAIRQRSEQLTREAFEQQSPYVIGAVPLLVEAGLVDRYDRVLVIDVPVEIQITRVMARDDSSREQALKIIQSQASREARLAVADDVIHNDQSLETLHAQVDALHNVYLTLL